MCAQSDCKILHIFRCYMQQQRRRLHKSQFAFSVRFSYWEISIKTCGVYMFDWYRKCMCETQARTFFFFHIQLALRWIIEPCMKFCIMHASEFSTGLFKRAERGRAIRCVCLPSSQQWSESQNCSLVKLLVINSIKRARMEECKKSNRLPRAWLEPATHFNGI